jgi:hypothetical protein
MDILSLKNVVFGDLKGAMGFIKSNGFRRDDDISFAKRYGDTIYFYSENGEWITTPPVCKLYKANINVFKNEQHSCTLDTGTVWLEEIKKQLKKAAKMVFEQKLLRRNTAYNESFEHFWETCSVPKKISLVSYAFTKRGHRKQFVNMYNDGNEITGSVSITDGSLVKCPIRWTMTESGLDDRPEYGFRANFGPGIEILKLAGNPIPIKRPWDWSTVNFETLNVSMHDHLIVKSPPLEILKTWPCRLKLDIAKKSGFFKAMNDFHRNAGAEEWDGVVQLRTSKTGRVGDFALMNLVATRNTNNIHWHSSKFLSVPPNRKKDSAAAKAAKSTTPAPKRDADNMDTSLVSKTKRQCISSGIGVHKKE